MEESYKQKQQTDIIDLGLLIRKVLSKKKLFLYKVWPISFVLSCIYILGIPRYYSSNAKLAPEMGGTNIEGSIASVASSFGFDLGGMQTTDAITPLLYPDLMEDNGFVTGLFNIKVVSQDGEISSNYHDYLSKHQKRSVWSYPMSWLKKLLPSKNTNKGNQTDDFNPYILSESENNIAEAVRSNVQFSVDKKTGVISITTKAQDALISKTLADSISVRLQEFITEYRTNKARIDYAYYKQLAAKAKQDYEKVRQQYGSLSDANTNVKLHSVELQLQDMENEMQLKFNAYSTVSTQLEAAKAKVQERTPAFTLLKGASMPIKPAGPKRIFFVLGMLIFSTLLTIVYIVKDDIKESLLQSDSNH